MLLLPRCLALALGIITFLNSCQKQSENHQKTNFVEITRNDSTEIIQNILNHKPLDSLLNFAFKDKPLKIVKNNLIRQPLNLTMNNKNVEFSDIDSSSEAYRLWNKPVFFAKITIFKITMPEARIVVFFESIGLFGEYWLKKNLDSSWEIVNFNFAHT